MTTTPGQRGPGRPRRNPRIRVGLMVLALGSLAGWGIEADACRSTPRPTIKKTVRRTVKTTTVKPTPTPKPSVVVPTPIIPLPLPEVVKPTTPITPTTCCSCVCPPSKPISPGTVRPQVEVPEPCTAAIGLALLAAGAVIQRRFRRA